MEPRIAKLEAQVAAVQVDLAKLAGVPVDVATMKERLSHIPTKVEMKGDIESAVDKAAARVQRTVAIVGGAVGLLVALINYGPRLLN
jgi:tetrahydromethanopterin S-methyltransferase subunit G